MTNIITMSEKESKRYPIIQGLIESQINGSEASKQCGVSIRHIRRLKKRVVKEGVSGIIHKSRGKKSNRCICAKKVKKIKKLIEDKYYDYGPTFASEKLEENHKIKISNESLRNLMIGWKLWTTKQRRKNKEHRMWRERRSNYGELIQFDGSYHKWFEERAPKCCLLAGIDDATGNLTKLEFTMNEGVFPVYKYWKEYVEKLGKPVSIYLDRHSTYKQNSKKNILDNPDALTQFEGAMKRLNIDLIHAYSPQAKGRVERLFGTLQDRLIKELRLEDISTLEDGNEYTNDEFITKFNEKFGVVPKKKKDLHISLTKQEKADLDHIFAKHYTRTVLNDFTIRFENKWFQLTEKQPTLVCRKDKVQIEIRLSEDIHIYKNDKELIFEELPERPKKETQEKNEKITALTRKKSTWKPADNHPWRKAFVQRKSVEIH